jgi:hypothetical protein
MRVVRRASEILDFPSENSLWRAFWAFRHRRGSCVGNRRRRRRPRATSNQRSIRYFQGRALGSPPVHRHKLKRIARHGEAEKTTPFVSSCYPVHCTNIILKGILRRRRWWHRSRKGRRHCAILAEQTSEGPFRNSCFFFAGSDLRSAVSSREHPVCRRRDRGRGFDGEWRTGKKSRYFNASWGGVKLDDLVGLLAWRKKKE